MATTYQYHPSDTLVCICIFLEGGGGLLNNAVVDPHSRRMGERYQTTKEGVVSRSQWCEPTNVHQTKVHGLPALPWSLLFLG